ncbi:hypothetical protein GIB19_28105, partial [Pseudomonas sp. ITEM 17296]|nr:hypothetical protein [Pseudomonas sp. ITEM 17296]
APTPGVDSTLNPIEKPMPRDTDPRIEGNDPESPPATQNDGRDLPGMDGSGSEGTGRQGTSTGNP